MAIRFCWLCCEIGDDDDHDDDHDDDFSIHGSID